MDSESKYENVRVFIQPDEVWRYYVEHQNELEDNMKMVASSDTDDFDKKSILFVTKLDGELFLSLEAPDVIVSGEYCQEVDVEDTVCRLLNELEVLSREVLV